MRFARSIFALMIPLVLVAAGPGSRVFKQGKDAEQAGRYGEAYLLYSQAVALEPDNAAYRAQAGAVRRLGLLELKVDHGEGEALEPEALPGIEAADLEEAERLLPPPVLDGRDGLRDFDLTGDRKVLWEKVMAPYGIEVVFEADLQPGRPARFVLSQSGWADTIRALEAVTGTFVVPMGPNVAMVAQDTVQKRGEMERHMAVALPFPQALSPQEVQEAARAVQATFDIQKFGVDNARGVVLFKDRASRVRPAVELWRQLLEHRAQVLLEVDLLSVNENSSLSLGMRLPTSFPIVNLSSAWNNSPSIPTNIGRVLVFGTGKWWFGLGLSSAELFASMTHNDSELLSRTRLRTLTGQASTIHVGDRYPIQTQAFAGGSTDGVFTPPPTIQFEDLGVVLKATPFVHGDSEVTLDIDADYKTLTGVALNGLPVISNRKLQSRVRLKFGQTVVVAGLENEAMRKSRSGLGPLVMVPALRANETDESRTQLLVTIRPVLVGLPPGETVTRPIWAGTETKPLSPIE